MVSWITREDLFDPTHPYAEIAAARASGILYNLTGEKFQGVHTDVGMMRLIACA